MKPTILVLAAGMASRYGSLKQIEKFGPSGESILDYSIYDAILAGYKKVVFVIQKNMQEQFKDIYESKFNDKIEVDYVYQELVSFIGDFKLPSTRQKPWGTGHAVLCAQEKINDPFVVINADDYYGRNGFKQSYDFLTNQCSEKLFALVAYELEKTLSDIGFVSRGICEINAQQELLSITERVHVEMINGKISYIENEQTYPIPQEALASMNFWCFHPIIFKLLQHYFFEFLAQKGSELKSEFFIPTIADLFIRNHQGKVKVLPNSEQWFGVTYVQDAEIVRQKIKNLVETNFYPNSLWGT